MGILRVLKWIAFTVFILAVALCGIGNYFVVSDMRLCTADKNDDVQMIVIKEALKSRNALKELFGKGEAADPVVPAVDPVPASTPAEADSASAPETAAPAIENANNAYTLDKHSKFVIALMKYGTASSPMEWLIPTDSFSSSIELNATQKKSIQETRESCGVNLCLFVAFCALLVAFLFHIITKRRKTVYGTILMTLGYLCFAGLLAAGYIVSAYLITLFSGSMVGGNNDCNLYQFIIITACFVLGVLIGLPTYACGIHRITIRRLKNRLSRRAGR